MDKQLFYQKVKDARERGSLPVIFTPEKVARMAYTSSMVDGVKCSYETLLDEARRLMDVKEDCVNTRRD